MFGKVRRMLVNVTDKLSHSKADHYINIHTKVFNSSFDRALLLSYKESSSFSQDHNINFQY